ncbi:hypothetical protein V8J88_15215 [Massilia sp. W12]|uniref:hypothetical protein n=1 Tax=Massilia sp. W12 TaxID=3126507 RepID=UPI0030D15F0E
MRPAVVSWRCQSAQTVLEIRLQLRPAHGRAAIKVMQQGRPATPPLAQAVQGHLQWQSFCAGFEAAPAGQQLLCELSHEPAGEDWPLACWLALLALRNPASGLPAQGAAGAQPDAQWHGALPLFHAAPPLPGPALRIARVYFPLIGAAPELAWVEAAQLACAPPAESALQVCGVAPDLAHAVCDTLQAARASECAPVTRWRSLLRFGAASGALQKFSGNSWQLAAVLADRISRGCELPHLQGRLIASGASHAWPQIDSVDGCAAKCALLRAQAQSGDRILLPQAWQAQLPADFAAAMQQQNCQLKLVGKIGFWQPSDAVRTA